MRGEGNHKIPGSFAPENMEKTGAERVKYSLACQHEDAISIKFVSYAQKCPTVLCTFAVALRKESVDRNFRPKPPPQLRWQSLSARRAWIEMPTAKRLMRQDVVALRKESVDRNNTTRVGVSGKLNVALRKESVDRNPHGFSCAHQQSVALRKESVDRNRRYIRSYAANFASLSARRAWIEIPGALNMSRSARSRSPQGERG